MHGETLKITIATSYTGTVNETLSEPFVHLDCVMF